MFEEFNNERNILVHINDNYNKSGFSIIFKFKNIKYLCDEIEKEIEDEGILEFFLDKYDLKDNIIDEEKLKNKLIDVFIDDENKVLTEDEISFIEDKGYEYDNGEY